MIKMSNTAACNRVGREMGTTRLSSTIAVAACLGFILPTRICNMGTRTVHMTIMCLDVSLLLSYTNHSKLCPIVILELHQYPVLQGHSNSYSMRMLF